MPEQLTSTTTNTNNKLPAMSYGKEISSTRSQVRMQVRTSTVEIMANSGLKYVHAYRGEQGMEGDWEKSKKYVRYIIHCVHYMNVYMPPIYMLKYIHILSIHLYTTHTIYIYPALYYTIYP